MLVISLISSSGKPSYSADRRYSEESISNSPSLVSRSTPTQRSWNPGSDPSSPAPNGNLARNAENVGNSGHFRNFSLSTSTNPLLLTEIGALLPHWDKNRVIQAQGNETRANLKYYYWKAIQNCPSFPSLFQKNIWAPKKTNSASPMIFSLSTCSFSTQMEAASWNFCSQRELDRDLSTAKELQSLCCRVVRARGRESWPRPRELSFFFLDNPAACGSRYDSFVGLNRVVIQRD